MLKPFDGTIVIYGLWARARARAHKEACLRSAQIAKPDVERRGWPKEDGIGGLRVKLTVNAKGRMAVDETGNATAIEMDEKENKNTSTSRRRRMERVEQSNEDWARKKAQEHRVTAFPTLLHIRLKSSHLGESREARRPTFWRIGMRVCKAGRPPITHRQTKEARVPWWVVVGTYFAFSTASHHADGNL